MKSERSYHRGVRVRPALDAAVEEERAAAGDAIDYTEALHRLGLRGAAKGTKEYYLATTVGHRAAIEEFWRLVDKAERELSSVRPRLAGPLRPIPNDPERSANIEEWRKLTQELPPDFRHLLYLASGISDVLCGLTLQEIKEIKQTGLRIAEWLPGRKEKLKKAEQENNPDGIETNTTMIKGYEAFLKITQRLLGSNYAEFDPE